MSATRPSNHLERTILIIAVAAFFPTVLFLRYLHDIGITPSITKVFPPLHLVAEFLGVFVSVSLFLLAWHTYPDRRDTFILSLGNAFLLVGLLSLLHIVHYQESLTLIKNSASPNNPVCFHAISQLFLPLGLLFSIFAVGRTFSTRRRLHYLLGVLVLLTLIVGAGSYLSCHRQIRLGEKSHQSALSPVNASRLIDRDLLTVPLYALAIYFCYKKKLFTEPKSNALFLGALALLAYSEALSGGLCFQCKDCPLKNHNPFSHLFTIAAYGIIYWVVFVSSVRYPYKALYAVKEDLSEKYQDFSAALEMLKQSEERYRLLVENSNDLIYTLDSHSRITFVNQNISILTGYTPAELRGKSVFDILTPESQKKAIAQIRTLVKTRRTLVEDLQILAKDGKKRTIMVNIQPIHDAEGKITGFQGVARDISERSQQQEQMIHSEKLATVGLIASGIAHEIGTPLNIISGNAEFLLADLPEYHPMREELETIVDQCQRISDQVKSLLDFARPSSSQFAPLNINEIIHDTLRLLKHMIKPNHNIQFNLTPEMPPLMGDKYRLRQLFINLLLNAFQAMPAGGSLTISTRLLSGSRAPKVEDPYVDIKIQDSGQGIEKENLKSIFDPFFTTKAMGQGTGLGLAVCLRIVKDHEGSIEVESEVNKGATFTIHLPLRASLKGSGTEETISHV
ncbi:MAG: PAS domain S-box protein [Deltaproteobacteria bacterium]|nr:PAS domain S-box protein [Deltaproteobacteria bacterium]